METLEKRWALEAEDALGRSDRSFNCLKVDVVNEIGQRWKDIIKWKENVPSWNPKLVYGPNNRDHRHFHSLYDNAFPRRFNVTVVFFEFIAFVAFSSYPFLKRRLRLIAQVWNKIFDINSFPDRINFLSNVIPPPPPPRVSDCRFKN